jgi:pSer/pThr/pTyr-binding forkhead associated (FHA) protein
LRFSKEGNAFQGRGSIFGRLLVFSLLFFSLSADAGTPTTSPRPKEVPERLSMRAKLKVLNGKSAGREVKVPQTGMLIGRSEECHLRPKSDAVSRCHCELSFEDDKLVIRDLGSKNGTYVNGKKIDDNRELNAGDQLLIGKLELEVMIKVAEPVQPQPDRPSTEESSWAVDDDISSWLEDASQADQGDANPDTRQFRIEELQRASNESTLNTLKDSAVKDTNVAPESGEKEQAGKLPPRKPDSDSSKAAANNILKRFFNRP